MAQVEATVEVPVEPALAFAVSQTTGATRYRWDPFVREQSLLDGRARPGRASGRRPGRGTGWRW